MRTILRFFFVRFLLVLAELIFACTVLIRGAFAEMVHGRVHFPEGQDGSNVAVTLRSRKGLSVVSTRTDTKGWYRFENMTPGEYLLEANDVSSTFGASVLILLRPDENITRNIELKVRGMPTEIQVTASGIPQILSEVSKAADVLDGNEIRRRAEHTILEAIRNIPGVRVKQSGGPGSLASIETRGLRHYDTSLLIDGLRLRDAAGTQGSATSFYENLVVLDTERIEFVRGSGSSMYGSHAMGGVINLTSRTGGGPTHGEVSFEGGGLGSSRSLARVGGGLGSLDQFMYSAGISRINVTKGVDGFDPYRNTSGHGSIGYKFSPSVSLSGRIWVADASVALNESPMFDQSILENHPLSGPVPAIGLAADQLENFSHERPFEARDATFIQGFNDPDSYRLSSFLAGALVFQHELNPFSSYRVSYHGVDTKRSFRDGPGGRSLFDPEFGNDSLFNGHVDTVTARTNNQFKDHMFSVGYEYEREQYFNLNVDENPDPILQFESSAFSEQSSHAVFVQDQIRLIDGQLQVGLSGRFQQFSLDRPVFSGNSNPYVDVDSVSVPAASTADGAISYWFRSSNTKLRAHVGNSYRSPSSFERFGASFFGGWASFWGDPSLKPDRSIATDAGIDQWLLGSRLRLSGTYFYTSLQEVIVFDFGIIDPLNDPFMRFGGYRNTGGGMARGAELSASLALSESFRLATSYTYTDSVSHSSTVSGVDFFQRLGVSDHMFSLTTTQRFGKYFDVTFDLFVASDYPLVFFGANRRLMFDGPFKADLVAAYRFPIGESRELRLFSKVENLFNKKYFENGFESPGIWAIGGLSFSF
ncbi:MAG: hypothetical protein CMN58_06945 [Solibacterales bacterium]|nr:hypothetical protein [Bryobacterales bacterium]|tara:strand:- start:13231 stop:15681 length:2451 start_codon:yes stop_codon:yes gene_type:complete